MIALSVNTCYNIEILQVNLYRNCRHLVKKIFFLISQPKHMLWVPKRTVSMIRFLSTKTDAKNMGKKIVIDQNLRKLGRVYVVHKMPSIIRLKTGQAQSSNPEIGHIHNIHIIFLLWQFKTKTKHIAPVSNISQLTLERCVKSYLKMVKNLF